MSDGFLQKINKSTFYWKISENAQFRKITRPESDALDVRREPLFISLLDLSVWSMGMAHHERYEHFHAVDDSSAVAICSSYPEAVSTRQEALIWVMHRDCWNVSERQARRKASTEKRWQAVTDKILDDAMENDGPPRLSQIKCLKPWDDPRGG